jgi:hypothetical protein
MKTKIRWDEQEREAIYKQMVSLLRDNPILRKEELYVAAQSVLPVERRRKPNFSSLYKYADDIDRARAEAKIRPVEPLPSPPPTEAAPDLFRTILDQLLEALADKVAERLELRKEEAKHHPKHDPQPISAPRILRTGVLVIGLLNQQSQTIINTFPNLEFTCLTPEQALKRELLRRSHTILMTKFINHSVQDRYRKAQNLLLCNGGVSELSALLRNIK